MFKKYNTSKTIIIFAPFIEKGGIEKNLFLFTNFLVKKVDNIVLITWKKGDKKYFNKKIKIVNPSLFYQKIKNRNFKNIISLMILIKLIFNFRNCLIFSFQSNLSVTLVAKIFNQRNIVRIASYGWMLNYFKKAIFYFVLKLPTQIIVNSEEMKRILKEKFGIDSICIYNPLNKSQIDKLKITDDKFYKQDKKILKILFLGRLVDVKDPLMLLKSLTKLDKKINYELLMVGNGSMKKKIINFINEHSLKKNVKVISNIQNPMQYLNQCDLFVLTSKYEGLPNVLIEAQYLKKYIISTNCKTGPKEILLNGKLGTLVKVGDYLNLKKKIEYFYYNKTSKEVKNKLSKGFKYITRFDFDNNCKKLQKVVNQYLK